MGGKPLNIETWLLELGNPAADRDYLPGHARMQIVLDSLDLETPKLRIRIAGTNGKGSTAFMLAAALQSAGFKVGLYTSPHILAFNERIRINGKPVADVDLEQSLELIMPIALEAGASYFETATALALEQFSRKQVDVEILEAGVGARLDATTAVAADMALITPIALDHQNWLGDSLEEIAYEKAHAMSGCRCSLSAPQVDEVAAQLCSFNPDIRFCQTESWPGLAMPGNHQQINASLAHCAFEALADGLPAFNPDSAKDAIRHCRIPGRLEHITFGEADIWVDAAHNRHAIEALLPSLKALANPFDAILVFTREDRSLEDAHALLRPLARQLISNDGSCTDASAALQAQLKQTPNGSFLVLGSFITVAAIKRLSRRPADTTRVLRLHPKVYSNP